MERVRRNAKMAAKKLTDPQVVQDAIRAYQNGTPLTCIAEQLGVAFGTIRRALVKSGIEVRSMSEVQLLKNGKITTEISAERWRELYWGPEPLSVFEIARRFNVKADTVRGALVRNGIALRSMSEQIKIEFRLGRMRRGPQRPPPASRLTG